MLITDEKYWKKAVRNALAIGYEPGSGPVDRRERVAKSEQGSTAEIPLSPRQVQRYEDEGFEILANIIIERSSSLLGKKADGFADLASEEVKAPPLSRRPLFDRVIKSPFTLAAIAFAFGVSSSSAFLDLPAYKERTLKEALAHLDAKPETSNVNSVLSKVAVAVSAPSSNETTQGWGPKRPTFTIKKPAPYAVFNSITDHPMHGDERNFVQCRDRENSAWATAIQADDGHTYQCYVWFENAIAPNLDNENSAAKLYNARVTVRLQKSATDSQSLVGTLSANNSVSVWASCLFTANQPMTITYQRGTSRMYLLPAIGVDGLPLAERYKDDSLISGIAAPSGTLIGEKRDGILGQTAGYVLFDVKVELK
jgi:hypothetical protein